MRSRFAAQRARGVIAEATHPTVGLLRVVGNYIAFGSTRTAVARATPLLGEHSAAVLGEAGFSRAEVEQLFAGGLVRTESPGPD